MLATSDKVYGKNLVIIGGDAKLIDSLEKMFVFNGANVHTFTITKEGILATLSIRPDLIIFETSTSDITVPEFVTNLQTNELTKEIPIVIIGTTGEIEFTNSISSFKQPTFLNKDEFAPKKLVTLVDKLLPEIVTENPEIVFDISEVNVEQPSKTTKHIRLLVLEDDTLLRTLLSLRLEKSNIDHKFCHSGLDAMDDVLEYQPTIVILDIMLPGRNGLEILADIRKNPTTTNLPVIVFSNKDDQEEKGKARALGVENFLVKSSTDLNELINLIIKKG